MAKVYENEAVAKLSESVSTISVGNRTFPVQEMAIGRAKKFSLKLVEAIEAVKNGTDAADISEIEVTDLLGKYSEVIFREITKLVNFVFEYRNDDYEPLDPEWVEENFSVRELAVLVELVAEQNGMGWLLPFFKSRMMEVVGQKAGKVAEAAESKAAEA